jgi:hypothetical protein
MSDIHVIDDFFSNEIREVIFDKMLRPKWSFSGGGDGNVFWHQDGLEEEEYFSTYLYNIICTKIGRKFKNILRIYANGQTACQVGSAHLDDGNMTLLYYPNPEWQYEWQGHLMYLTQENRDEDTYEPYRVVRYRPNRAVLFPAKILHHADAPTRHFNGLRVSLAYKFVFPQE